MVNDFIRMNHSLLKQDNAVLVLIAEKSGLQVVEDEYDLLVNGSGDDKGNNINHEQISQQVDSDSFEVEVDIVLGAESGEGHDCRADGQNDWC